MPNLLEIRRVAALACIAMTWTGPAFAQASTPQVDPEPSAVSHAAPDWWHSLADPLIVALVERALVGNPGVEQASARLDRARAAARSTRAALLPNLSAGSGAAATRQSVADPITRQFANFPGFQRDIERYDASLSASWEIDLFGAAPRRRAARAGTAAAEADLRAVRVAVAAETATAVINIRELGDRRSIAHARIESLNRERDAVRLRAAAGAVARLDLDRLEGEAEAAAASLPAIEALLAAEVARLGVLVGDAEAARAAAAAAPINPVQPDLDLAALQISIARRPDVIAAEQRLAAADAGVAVAQARRQPSLSLAGLLASVASAPAALFTAAATSTQGSGVIRLPLFDFGRIDAAVADARGTRREALAGYRQALLQAAAEVEMATATLASRRSEAARQLAAATALARAETAATTTYNAGALDLTALLDAQRGRLAARENALLATAASKRAIVALFRATAGSDIVPSNAQTPAEPRSF